MGIRIDGASDLINASDGSLTVEGLSINVSGVVTASDGFKVGSAATIHSTGQFNIGVAHTLFANGNATFAGIVTASNTTISSTGIGIGAATNGSASYPSVTISGTSGGAVHFEDDGDLLADIYGSSDGLVLTARKTSDAITFQLNSGSVGEKARFDSSGRLLIGHTSSLGEVWNNDGGSLQVAGTSYLNSTFQISRWTNSASCPHFIMGKSRGGAVGTNVVVQDDDTCGLIVFAADDGTDLQNAVAEIRAQVDGTPGSNDTPGRLIFSTTPDGSNSRTERLRITSTGALGTNSTVRAAAGGLDLQSQGATDLGTLTLGASGGQNGQNRNANTENQYRIMMPTYADPSKMVTQLYGVSGSSGHEINYGGYTGWAYAANMHKFHTAADATTGTGTERLRIDASGRCIVGGGTHAGGSNLVVKGISGSTPNAYACASFCRIGSNPTAGTSIANLRFNGGSGGTSRAAEITVKAGENNWTEGSSHPSQLIFAVTKESATSSTERFRIDQSGRIDLFADANNGVDIHMPQSDTTEALVVKRASSNLNDGTVSFTVACDGDVENTNNSYGQLSDVKLKENIVDANSQWNDIKAVKVRNFNFKDNSSKKMLGVVAQELETVSSGLVYQKIDRDPNTNEDLGTVTKAVRYSVLYMKSVKALQEAITKIETLETKVAALESA